MQIISPSSCLKTKLSWDGLQGSPPPILRSAPLCHHLMPSAAAHIFLLDVLETLNVNRAFAHRTETLIHPSHLRADNVTCHGFQLHDVSMRTKCPRLRLGQVKGG